MSTATIEQKSAASVPPQKRVTATVAAPVQSPRVDDLESMTHEAMSIGLAVDWIIQAHTVLERIHAAAAPDSELRAALQRSDIRISTPDWDACQMEDHIRYILTRQHILIKHMGGAA